MITSSKRVYSAQTLHDSMVRGRANELLSQGYAVNADIMGFTQPAAISGYIPDIYAVKNMSRVIVEVETCESACELHTQEQFKVFSNVLNAEFHVVVPESCLAKAQNCAYFWGVAVDQWWYRSGC
jgi:hypothetical protein